MMTLRELPDAALTGRLLEIRKQERSLLVEFLRYLAELDRRKTVLALGHASLFAFCTEFLGLSKGSAYRRTKAARLLARFPVVADYLADGRLNLTNLVELRDVLDEAHVVEILLRGLRWAPRSQKSEESAAPFTRIALSVPRRGRRSLAPGYNDFKYSTTSAFSAAVSPRDSRVS